MQQKTRYRFFLSCFIGFLVCIGAHFLAPVPAKAIIPLYSQINITKTSQEDQALIHYSSGKYREAIKLWNEALTQTSDKKVKATLHTNLGSAYRQIGDLGQAIKEWELAIGIYKTINNRESTYSLAQLLTVAYCRTDAATRGEYRAEKSRLFHRGGCLWGTG
jgi:tetratricopeptide (TPR) repeat protein